MPTNIARERYLSGVLFLQQRVACHVISRQRGRRTTTLEYMPVSHRAHLEWTPQKNIDWGLRTGVSIAAVVTWLAT